MTRYSLDALDLAALLSSRVCHDVISPVGAIVNGLEVLEEENDPEMRGHALALIKSSANEASSRLQFCRLAFGAAGSKGASIDTGDAEQVTRQLLADERTRLNWSVPRVLMSKNKVKVLLNLCLLADATIPRGGIISVSSTGEEDKIAFRVEARGANARLAATTPALLAGDTEEGAIDARAIQADYTGLVARACGLDLGVSSDPEIVVFEARPAAVAPLTIETGESLLADAPCAEAVEEPQNAVA
jgi:histidine phosphotransferase ChpT